MTASDSRQDRDGCLEAGMDDYLTKPVAPAKLFEVLAGHLIPTLAPGEHGRPDADEPAAAAPADSASAPETSPASEQAPSDPARIPTLTPLAQASQDQDAVSDGKAAPSAGGGRSVSARTASDDAQAAETPPLDRARLLAQLGDDEALAEQVLIQFKGQAQETVAALHRAWSSGQFEEAQRHAHSLKGMAANVAADSAQREAAALEQLLAERGELGKAGRRLEALERALEAVNRYLEAADNDHA